MSQSTNVIERINYLDEKIHELISWKQIEALDNLISLIDGLNLPDNKVEDLYRELYHTIKAIKAIKAIKKERQ